MTVRSETAPTELVHVLHALDVPAVLAFSGAAADLLVNAEFRALTGSDASQPIRLFENGRPLTPAEHPWTQSLSGTTLTALQLEVECPDGSRCTVIVSSSPLRDKSGAITGAFTIMREAERILPGTLREISINTPALLFTTDAAGRVDSVNARWTTFVGAAAGELLGGGWTKFVHPDELARILDELAAHLVSGEPYISQWRFRRADGTFRWTEIRAEAQRDAQGDIRCWFGSGTDVDAQRRAMESLEFLAQSGATVAGAQDVSAVLDQLAHASLEDLADISIFDLEEEHGSFRRLVVAAPNVRRSTVDVTMAFQAPRKDEPHPIARAMSSGETIHIPDVDEDFIQRSISPPERQDAWRYVNIRSLVSAPMITPDRALGALTLLRTGTSVPFEASDVKVVEEVARRAAVAIENLRLRERERRAARDLQAFADLGESLANSLGLHATLVAAMRAVLPDRADWAFINLMDDRDELRLAAVYQPDAQKHRLLSEHIGELYARPDGERLISTVVRTRLPVFRARIDDDEAARNVNPAILREIRNAGLSSVIVVPLLAGKGTRGTLHVCMENEDRAFAQSDVEFFVEFARRLAPAIANAELFERERRVARSFQDAALPASLPQLPHFTLRAIYEAGKSEALVGGDWYDALSLANGRMVVSIGDVAGSGLSAAVTMASVRQAIRGAAHVRADPGVLLEAADRAVMDDPERRFVTAFVGVIDPADSTITYQSAGHPGPLLRLPDGTLTELTGTGTPLGLRDHQQSNRTRRLPAGSLLVLYTDGLIESTHDILDGEERLRKALLDPAVAAADNPAKMLHDVILTEGSRDDVAILTIQVR